MTRKPRRNPNPDSKIKLQNIELNFFVIDQIVIFCTTVKIKYLEVI